MARLTRVQKYSEYREKMANDAETQLMTQDLSKYQDELNKVKNITSSEAVADMTNTSFQDNSSDSVFSALNDILNSVGDFNQLVKNEPLEEETIDISELLKPVKEDNTNAQVETTPISEMVETLEPVHEVNETVQEEVPAAEEVVDVLGADEILSQMRNDEGLTSLEESYRDSVNSIIDELLASNTIDDTAFTAPDFLDKEEPDTADEPLEDTLDLDINDILALDKETETVEEEPAETVEEEVLETEIEEKLPLYTIPVVKKPNISFEELNNYVDETVKDIETTVDSERIILGIPSPTIWIEEPKVIEVPEVKEEDIEDVSSTLFDIISELEKEFTTKIDTLTPELLEETNETEQVTQEVPAEVEIFEPVEQENVVVETEEAVEPVEEVSETIEHVEPIVEEAELVDDTMAALEENAETVEEDKPIFEETAPLIVDVDEELGDVIDNLVATNEINSSFVSEALKEADAFSAKEGLKTVEDLQRSIIKEIAETQEHPVIAIKKTEDEGDTEVIEIPNFADLPKEDRDAVLDDTIPFVIDRQKEKTQEIHLEDTEEEDDLIPNNVLNIILFVLIVVLLLVLGVVVYYILAAQGII